MKNIGNNITLDIHIKITLIVKIFFMKIGLENKQLQGRRVIKIKSNIAIIKMINKQK